MGVLVRTKFNKLDIFKKLLKEMDILLSTTIFLELTLLFRNECQKSLFLLQLPRINKN